MTIVRRLARPMLAASFVQEGMDAVLHPGKRTDRARRLPTASHRASDRPPAKHTERRNPSRAARTRPVPGPATTFPRFGTDEEYPRPRRKRLLKAMFAVPE